MCPARMWGPGSDFDWKDVMLWGRPFRVPVSWDFSTDSDGTIRREPYDLICPPSSIFFDAPTGFFDPADPGSIPELTSDEYDPPDDLPDEYLRALEESARWLHHNTDFSITCGEVITDLQIKVGGFVPWWIPGQGLRGGAQPAAVGRPGGGEVLRYHDDRGRHRRHARCDDRP